MIDIDKALSFPLAPVPLSLATADGMRRKTAKSKLLQAALASTVTDIEHVDDATCYVVDLVAIIRSTVRIPDTFRELAMKLLNEIPRQYNRVYIACDTYSDGSIKNAERALRGEGDHFFIKTPDIKIPPNFVAFLSNGQNKERLFELVEEVWVGNSNVLGDREIYFSRKDGCIKINRFGVSTIDDLRSNHEEADTKVCFLLHHALQQNEGRETICILRSCSGDIDIPVILLASHVPNLQVFIDSGTGKNRKILDLAACDLSVTQRKALLGLHAFSGNDYISSFFKKGKKACWKTMQGTEEFVTAFAELGTSNNPANDVIVGIEKFTCALYGEKRLSSVDDVRRKIFWRNFSRDKKITDLSLLPPCKDSLVKHIKRSNYIAHIWRQASLPMIEQGDPSNHGWKADFSVDWISQPYPEDISELLVDINEVIDVQDLGRDMDTSDDENEDEDE